MVINRREFNDESAAHVASAACGLPEDYALVIGVNDYPQIRPLRGAIADARAFAAWLVDAMGGNVPKSNVFTIFSTSDPLTPLGHEINDALEVILERAERTGGRRFYFYFSGHGAVGDRANDLALCLANWSELRRRAALSSDAWLDVVVRSGLFDEVAFFLDCCRVWATRAVGMPPRIDFVKPVERPQSTRVFMAYATEFQRAAVEIDEPFAGNSSESRGIFTQVLLDVLQAHAASSEVVTAAFLKACIERQTENRARACGLYQRAEVLNGFRNDTGFGSGQRIVGGSDEQSQVASSAAYQNAKNVLRVVRSTREWLKAYEEFRPRSRLHLHRPAMEYSNALSRLQVVVFPHAAGREGEPDSSSNTWSIWPQFQHDDPMLPGRQPFTPSTQGVTPDRNIPIGLAPDAAENSPIGNGFFFSGDLTSGAYVLRHSGRQSREVEVHLFCGWTTLIAMADTNEPDFENSKVFLIPRTANETLPPWSSIEEVATIVTILNLGLISPRTKNEFRDHATSFADPMLALLAAHSIARLKDPDASRIEAIASQVQAMIGACPDVDALFLRAALIRGDELPELQVTTPPMLREGLLALVEASHKMPDLIPPGSLLEYACVERLVDSPLSSWPRRWSRDDSDDWLATSIEDLATQTHEDAATLDAATIARELAVPTQAVTSRLAATREQRTRKAVESISSEDTSSQKTKWCGDPRTVDTASPSIPGYEIGPLIGKGGMGQVYLAKHIATGDRVAIKVIHQDAGISIKARQRFLREIDTLVVLQHERIVALLDHGYANGFVFFTMPYYERGNVARWVTRNGGPTLDEATRIIRDVLEGLAFAHQRGYVHRDIKPQNLLLDDQNRVILADFGLAKEIDVTTRFEVDTNGVQPRPLALRALARLVESAEVDPNGMHLRQPISSAPAKTAITTLNSGGARPPSWLGTPEFMAPEQMHNFRGVRAPTDVWALAAVFYWLLCGMTPHNAMLQRRYWRLERQLGWPIGLSNFLQAATNADPAKRPKDAAAFRFLLEEAMKTPSNQTALPEQRTSLAPAIDRNIKTDSTIHLHQIRGAVLRAVDKAFHEAAGWQVRGQLIAQLPPRYANEFHDDSINWLIAYDLEALNAYMDLATSIFVHEPNRWRQMGRSAVEGELHRTVRSVLRPAPDLNIAIRRGISIWSRLFSFGTWNVDCSTPGHVLLRVGEFEPASLALRLWMVGVIEETIRRAVNHDVCVNIVAGQVGASCELRIDLS